MCEKKKSFKKKNGYIDVTAMYKYIFFTEYRIFINMI